MSSSQNSQIKSKSKTHKSQHEETYNLVLKCEHIVKNRARRPIRRKLREQTTFFTRLSIFQLIHTNNIFSKISICLGEFFLNLSKFKKLNNYFNYCKYFLFKNPNIIFFIPLIFSGVLFVFLVPLIQLLKLLKWYNTTIQVILFLGISAIFIFSVVFPYIIIPRVIVEHDSKWMDVKKIYLRYIRRNILKQKDFIKEAKNRLKRAIDYYRRKGEIWDLLLAFTWGSI